MPNYFLRFLYTLIFTFAVSYSATSQSALKSVRLQLKWYHQFQFAGYYAAVNKGFYSKEGLDLKIIEGSNVIIPITQVVSNKAEFGIFDPGILFKNPKNTPIMAVFATLQSSPYCIFSNPKSNISRPSDLVDKRVLTNGDQGWNIFKAIMLKEGLPVDRTKLIKRNKDSEEILEGKADAVITYYSSQYQRLKDRGIHPSVIRPLDYGVDFYGDVIFTTKKFADENPEIVEAFNRATRQGWEYALSHKAEMIDYILTLPSVKHRLNRKELEFEAVEIEKLIVPNFVEIGHMNPGRWQNMLTIYQRLGFADKSLTLKGFLFEPKAKSDRKWVKVLIYSLAVATLLILAGWLWNMQLRKQVLTKTNNLLKEIEDRRRAEQRLELAIVAAGLGVWEWELKTDTFTFNSRWGKMFGYHEDNLPQTFVAWKELCHPEDAEKVHKANQDLKTGAVKFNNINYRLKTSAGTWKWVLSFRKVSEYDAAGLPERITGMHLDIDSIKNKETESKELTKELMKKNGELEKFAYITSHNLRAPVVNLKSLTDIYGDEDLDKVTSEEIFSKIKESVNRLDNTLNDLVEIVSSKSGEHIRREELNLKTELDAVLFSIEKQVNDSDAVITSDFTEANSIVFPRKYLHSIYQNLITNAIKYRSPKRPLIIHVKAHPYKNFVMLKFSDNGLGMDIEKNRNKIFGLYQRFHPDTEGRGLGLYIVKSQIEAMDGKISVYSTIDGGTMFKISFHNPGIITPL